MPTHLVLHWYGSLHCMSRCLNNTSQANGLPTLVFLVFLGSQLRRSVRKLRLTHSQIMLTYYATLWAVSVLNLLRCGVMMVEARYTGQAHWNALWLLTSSVSVLLEVSVVVFLLQGYLTSGSEVGLFCCCVFWIDFGCVFGCCCVPQLPYAHARTGTAAYFSPRWTHCSCRLRHQGRAASCWSALIPLRVGVVPTTRTTTT